MIERDHIRTQRLIDCATIPNCLGLLRSSRIEFDRISHGHYRVAGRFDFYPATGFWSDGVLRGYTVSSLIAEIRLGGNLAASLPAAALPEKIENVEAVMFPVSTGQTSGQQAPPRDVTFGSGSEQPGTLSQTCHPLLPPTAWP